MGKFRRSFAVALFGLSFLSCVTNNGSDQSTRTDAILVYSSTTISEATSNDGTFDSTISIVLTGDEFVDTLTNGTEFEIQGLPTGLTATLDRTSATTATLVIAGVATPSNYCSDTSMLFFFNSSAFVGAHRPVSSTLPIDIQWFSPTLAYSATAVNEDPAANDGSITDTITVTAQNGGIFEVNGVPAANGDILIPGRDYSWTFPVATKVQAVSSTVATISFVGTAASSSPLNDLTGDNASSLTFKIGKGVSSDYCASEVTQKVSLQFVRTIVMYALGGISNGNFGGRAGADTLCFFNQPQNVPSDYTSFKAFASFDATHEIRDLDVTGGVPSALQIEGASGARIDNSFNGLLDGFIFSTLTEANVTSSRFWSGSNSDGSLSSNCNGFTSSSAVVNSAVGNPADKDDASMDGSTWIDDGSLGSVTPATCNSSDKVLLCIMYPG